MGTRKNGKEIAEGFWSLLRSWLRPHRGVSQERLPLYLGFFEFVHNIRRRGKALLGAVLFATRALGRLLKPSAGQVLLDGWLRSMVEAFAQARLEPLLEAPAHETHSGCPLPAIVHVVPASAKRSMLRVVSTSVIAGTEVFTVAPEDSALRPATFRLGSQIWQVTVTRPNRIRSDLPKTRSLIRALLSSD